MSWNGTTMMRNTQQIAESIAHYKYSAIPDNIFWRISKSSLPNLLCVLTTL